MKILIVGSGPSGYQFKRLKEEAEKRGHRVDRCYSADLVMHFDANGFRAEINGLDLSSFDVVRLQTVSRNSVDWHLVVDYYTKNSKTKFVDTQSVKLALGEFSMGGEYLACQREALAIPRSFMARREQLLVDELKNFSLPCIIKTTNSRKGLEVGLVKSVADISEFVLAHPLVVAGTQYILREFIPNDGDLRVFVIGGRAIGAMKRSPKSGEFRANISQGGSGAVFDLTVRPDIQAMAEKIATVRGLDFAGVDVIINSQTDQAYLLEVNDGPQIEGFEKYTGINVAGLMIEYFEHLADVV